MEADLTLKDIFRAPGSSPFAYASRFSTKPKHPIAISGQGIGDDKLAILGNSSLSLPRQTRGELLPSH
jgi:hypothetical protein